MGWWRIDPATGKSFEGGASKLSRPPDFVLLNAVPGVDDDEEAHYLGDGPWDMASTLPQELADVVGPGFAWTGDMIRNLFLKNQAPAGLDKETAFELLEVVKAFWKDIDSCYEDDWDRGASASEKRWICEYTVERLAPQP